MSEPPKFPDFNVPGVPHSKLFMLYGASNYPYYKDQIRDITLNICAFCSPINEKKNAVLPQFAGRLWHVWDNLVAPRPEQDHQFVIPCCRHIVRLSECTDDEILDLLWIIRELDKQFNIDGSDIAARCGPNQLKTAQSIGHFHVNYHVPTGAGEVRVTFAKSQEDLFKKRELLMVWEKMRLMEERGITDPFSALLPFEQEMTRTKMGAPKLKAKTP